MSDRNLTPEVTAEITKPEVAPLLLVEMLFDSGPLRVWSGSGELSWNGHAWLGAGDLGAISPIKETESLVAEGVTLSLSGIPTDNIVLALTEKYRRRPATIWLGFLAGQTVISDPIPIFAGRMDVMEIEESGETSTISVTVESRLVDLRKTRERRYTHEDQQIDYPGDLGFEFIVDLQNKEIEWEPS